MAVMTSVPPQVLTRQIRRLQVATVAWESLEAGVALFAAWSAHSPALLAFGGDSLIELLSAAVVLWRFSSLGGCQLSEKRAARISGALLFALAPIVLLASVLVLTGLRRPEPTLAGMAILLVAAFAMPWLARQKRRLSAVSASASLRADAAESALCGYMAWIALAGVLVNAVWSAPWADPMAALILIPLIFHEGWEAIYGRACRPCC